MCTLTYRIKPLIDVLKVLLDSVFMGKSSDKFLVGNHFLGIGTQLSLKCLLACKRLSGKTGHQRRGHNRKRRRKSHHKAHWHGKREHKSKRSYDGNHAGKKLSKTLQETVSQLINIVDHTGGKVPLGMRVNIGKRETRDLLVSGNTNGACCFIGQTICGPTCNPLGHADAKHHKSQLDKYGNQRGFAPLYQMNQLIDSRTNDNRHPKLEHHSHNGP